MASLPILYNFGTTSRPSPPTGSPSPASTTYIAPFLPISPAASIFTVLPNLPPRTYWSAVALVTIAYFGTWLFNFQYVYGWIMDDRYEYLKGLATTTDPRGAFSYFNYQHAYYYLISYLPLKLPITVESYHLPTFGHDTGHFRFFLLYTIFLHSLLLPLWATSASLLWRHRLGCLLSLIFFASSPTFVLWTPLPDSRVLGLLFFLPAIALLTRLSPTDSSHPNRLQFFCIGVLFSVAQSVQYTTLYVIIPLCLAYWLLCPILFRVRPNIMTFAVFCAGCLTVPLIVESVSGFILAIPPSTGPFMTMLERFSAHRSHWSVTVNVMVWLEMFFNQIGLPMLLAALIGWFVVIHGVRLTYKDHSVLAALVFAIPVGLGWLAFCGCQPMFRQSSVLQPFLYLFAAHGVVILLRISLCLFQRVLRLALPGHSLSSSPQHMLPALCFLLAIVEATPWRQAADVFSAHLSLGRAIEWAYSHADRRPLAWVRIAWFEDPASIIDTAQLQHLDPESWLITYYPLEFIRRHPAAYAQLLQVRPIASWPSLYATDSLYAELRGRGYASYRSDPVLGYIQILPVRELLAAMDGAPLVLSALSTSDNMDAAHAGIKVFDQGTSRDGATAWMTAARDGVHWIEMHFADLIPLGSVQVVAMAADEAQWRIPDLTVAVGGPDNTWQVVWSKDNLTEYGVIGASWEVTMTNRVRISTTGQAIEEIVFPGYRIVVPTDRQSSWADEMQIRQ